MKPRASDRTKSATELDLLNEKLARVRAESRRIAASRIATKEKLEGIGKDLSERTHSNPGIPPRGKK